MFKYVNKKIFKTSLVQSLLLKRFTQKAYFLNLNHLPENCEKIVFNCQNTNISRNLIVVEYTDSSEEKENLINCEVVHNKESCTSFTNLIEDDIHLKINIPQKQIKYKFLFDNKDVQFKNNDKMILENLEIETVNTSLNFKGEMIKIQNLEIISTKSDIKFSSLMLLNSTLKLTKSDLFCQYLNFYKSNIKLCDSQMIIKNIVEIDQNNMVNFKQESLFSLLALKGQNFKISSENSIFCCDSFSGNIDYNSLQNSNLTINKIIGKEVKFNSEKNDLISVFLEDLENNSLIKIRNSSFKFKINPFLILGINVFNAKDNKFFKFRLLDKEGVSFCPTLIIDYDGKLEAKDLIEWKLISPGRHMRKMLIISLIIFFLYLMTVGREYSNNIYSQYSDFKLYQLFFRKRVEGVLEKVSK
jgi:hypothetical protein